MKKTFIGTASLQKPYMLHYHAVDNSRLQYEQEVDNPLYLLIRGYAEKGDTVKIIVCVTENDFAKENVRIMKDEFNKIGEEIGFVPEVVELMTPNDQGLQSHASLLSNLVKLCGEDQLLYVDVTYGTKPIPIVYFNFLRYMTRVRNCGIGCVCYGYVLFKGKDNPDLENIRIYDISPLYKMTTIIDYLGEADSKIQDTDRLFQNLIDGARDM